MYVYVCITLLCIWKIVSQLHFNKICIKNKKKSWWKIKDLRLPSPVQRPPTTDILEGCVASARPYWPCSELYRGHQGHWQIKGKDGRKAGKKLADRRRQCTARKGRESHCGRGSLGCRVRPATPAEGALETQTPEKARNVIAPPVTEWSRRQTESDSVLPPPPGVAA